MKKIAEYIVMENATILETLRMIDKNASGYVIVTDNEETVLGVLTDGDIRRAFINGSNISDSIGSIFIRTFKYLTEEQSLGDAVELFRSSAINFLPILDKSRKLINIINKKQLHALMLFDIHADLKYNFFSLDENAVDHEIFERPWGFYKTTVKNTYFQSKIISIKPKGQLSLQSHRRREEYWIIAHGKGVAQKEDSYIEVRCGSTLFIPRNCRHRLINTDEKESLIITEVQIGDYFGEDDIERYEDIYGRIKSGRD